MQANTVSKEMVSSVYWLPNAECGGLFRVYLRTLIDISLLSVRALGFGGPQGELYKWAQFRLRAC
jgi:hypothetical protein